MDRFGLTSPKKCISTTRPLLKFATSSKGNKTETGFQFKGNIKINYKSIGFQSKGNTLYVCVYIYICMPLDDFWARIFGLFGLNLLVKWVSAWSFGFEPPGLVPGG